MNREVKFNAWLPKLGIMIEGVSVGLGSCGFPADETGEFEKMLKEKGLYDDEIDNLPDYIYLGEDWWVVMGDENFILLQYIGKEDQNGRNIYEGDVVTMNVGIQRYANWQVGDPTARINGWVSWNPHQLNWEIRFPNNKYGLVSSSFGWGSAAGEKFIGDIFSNPGLISPDFDPLNIPPK